MQTTMYSDAAFRIMGWVAMGIALAACQSHTETYGGGDRLAPKPSMNEIKSAMATTISRADPQMKAVLDELQSLGGKPIESLSAEDAREQPTPADAVKAVLKKQGKSTAPEPVGNIDNRTISGPGGPIPIRIYTPKGNGPFPIIVYYHGGGWVIATMDTYDSSARTLTNAAKAIVVSVEYRKAPEHKFPAAHEDAYAAYQWTLKHASDLHGDPSKVAVAGESAGGNLAAAVAMMAREQGDQLPVHQVLIYPVVGHDFNTPSYQENAKAKPLNKPMMAWFFEKYLKNPGEADNPLISLDQAKNLRGLPPATIITDEIDPLRSEGKRYADRLREAGVPVTYKNYEGVTHEFFGMGAVVDKAKQAVALAGMDLTNAFNSGPSAALRR